MQLQLRDDVQAATGMINDIEWIKKQLDDLTEALDAEKYGNVIEGAETLHDKLQMVEDKIFQPIAAEGDSKSFRFPNMLYSKLSVLAGDLSSSVDFAPNKQQRDVYRVLKERLVKYQAELQQLLDNDVAAFNRMVRELNLTIIASR